MGVCKCQTIFLWTLLFAVTIAVVPRYVEIRSWAAATASPIDLPPPLEFTKGLFKQNETLSTTLVKHQISSFTAHQVAEAVRPFFDVRDFRAGRAFKIIKDADGRLRAFEYRVDDERTLRVDRRNDKFIADLQELDFEIREGTIVGTINSSLWNALESFPKRGWLVMELEQIYQYDIDFFKEIRPGDSIKLIIDKKYYRGEFVKYGPIRGAEFVNRGRPYQAFLFRGRYYDEDGMGLERSLLRAPLNYSRVSSGFTYRRLHPIYKTVRPHLGVDYAAPTGTPVHTVSNGTVVFAGRKGGFGRMVTVRHKNAMTTSYAHLSRISVSPGQKVDLGDTLGAVGMTGTATGPHLDYRMTIRGKPVDPRRIKADPPKPIDPSYKPDYLLSIKDLQSGLQVLDAQQLAKNRFK